MIGRAIAAGLWTALLAAQRADLRRAVLNILICGRNLEERSVYDAVVGDFGTGELPRRFSLAHFLSMHVIL
jgi:hypothetical protein